MATMTENEVLSWFEKTEPREEPLMCAYEYLRNYHKDSQKRNDELSWDDLQRYFGRPVYYVRKESDSHAKARGWMILYELHITQWGHFVIGENDVMMKFENTKFYRKEI